MIVPLHNHSDYSNLDGNALPVEIAARAKQIGCPACAITDHGVVTGHLDFAKEMTAVGIKPIFGIEAYHGEKWTGWKGNERDAPHLILLAMNNRGLKNLWTIVHYASHPDRFRFVPRVSWDDLEKYNEGLICTSACSLGKVAQEMIQGETRSLDRYLGIFGDRFYGEIHTYDHTKVFEDAGSTQQQINEDLVHIFQERGVGVTYANDAHYAFPDQYEFHDAYVVARTGKMKKGEPDQTVWTDPADRKMWHPKCLYIMDEQDVRTRLNYLPGPVVDEAVENSVKIGEMCNAELPEVRRHLPIFIPKDCPSPKAEGYGEDAESLFVDLVTNGIKEKYPAASNEVWKRALRETEIFLDSGLHHYFLMAWDLCEYCDENGIARGPGRGSSAGCIVAYALGITDVDPLHYGLIFERFWNAGRAKGFPDIDSDFARRWRSKILQYLKWRWGEDRVYPIGTTGRMKPKAACDRLRGALGMTYEEAEELKSIVNQTMNINILGPDSIAWSREADPDYVHKGKERTIYVEDHVGEEIAKWVGKDKRRARYVRTCAYLTNRAQSYGIHPSGVLICDESLTGLVPTDARGEKDDRRQVTQFTMDEIDKLLMIKLDVLGLKTLDTLDDWWEQMHTKGVDIEWSSLDKLEYPEEMWELLDRGFTAGIFQVEAGLARGFLKNFKARSVEDLAIAGSIIRPGPNQSMDSFLVRRNGGTDDEFDGRTVPLLKPILDPTYGWFLYQEQVIAFFTALGYNLSDADAVRKILGKKKPEDLVALHEGQGEWAIIHDGGVLTITPMDLDGRPMAEPFTVTNRGYKEVAYPQLGQETADIIWDKLEDFARYSFNKSHSVAYAVIGFRCLLSKFYAPAEWYRACIRTVDDSDKAERIPMYISEARRMGIGVHPPDILNSGPDVEEKDGDIYMGFGQVKGVATGGDVIVGLRDAGFDISTPEKLWELTEADAKQISKLKAVAKKAGVPYDGPEKSMKQRLNSGKVQALLDVGAWDSLGERNISLSEKQKMEKELMGVILTDDSAQVLMNNEEQIAACDTYHDLEEAEPGDIYMVPGVVTEIRVTKSRNSGRAMGIVTIEFQGDTIQFATSPVSWKSHRFLWRERTVGIFTIKKGGRGYLFEDGEKLK